MILIICAAGRGSRIRSVLKSKPKSLISFKGITVLENLLNIFDLSKISQVIIIVGYKKDKIIKKIGYRFKDKKIMDKSKSDIINREGSPMGYKGKGGEETDVST